MQFVLLQLAALVLFQIGNDLLGFALRLLQYPARLVLGLAQFVFAACGKVSAQLVGLVAQLLGLQMRLLGQLAFLLGDLPVVFGIGDDVLEAHLVVRDAFARVVDQLLWQAQLARNFKCVALARDADGQAVGRPQGLTLNSTEAFSTPGVDSANTFSSL